MAAQEDTEQSRELEHAGHRHERPEDWGWHAEMGGIARGFGLVVAIILVLMLTANHERNLENIWLVGIAAAIIGTLIWDRQRRKHAWRE